MRRLFFEFKIIGTGALLIFATLTLVLTLIAIFGGELLSISIIGFEVIYPFITSIAVGEWGKTRADANFDIIAAQGTSLFGWVTKRFLTPFLMASSFAFLSMGIVFFIRREMPIWEMILLYLSPAFFLSSLCALGSICFKEEHVSTLISGAFGILSLMIRALLRLPGMEYVYLFIRHAGDTNSIWWINKTLLMLIGSVLWIATYAITRGQPGRRLPR